VEDKTFQLLEIMYSDITKRFDGIDSRLNGIDVRLDGIDVRLDGIDSRLDKLEERQRKLEVTLENDIKVKLQALHEREAANSDKLDNHGRQISEINNKLDYFALSMNSQDKRLEIVESSGRKKAK